MCESLILLRIKLLVEIPRLLKILQDMKCVDENSYYFIGYQI